MSSTEGQHHEPHYTHAHAHGHGHGHGHHGHHLDITESNKQHFNEHASNFDEWPRARERAQRVGVAIREVATLNKETTSVLEFACGTGLVAKEVYPYVHSVVGMDISSGVVELCNKRFKEELGADEKETYAVAANILTDKDVLPGKLFDVVFCSSAYHHFEFPAEITKALIGFLKPGGALLIIDQYLKPGEAPPEVPEEHRHHVTRFGYTEEDMKELLAGAGLEVVSFKEIEKDPQDTNLFIAKAVKPKAN
ncbi:hypothetical protein EST38_g4040 [Candolleomyces aberdarensis]|uniref:S-adenosyl-L-methionine-dependent methyltransferase n=1 Tax=Candolleomyces aberdarensis TaxID=2316362 RepID=A0A4V1Q4E6_9AGAR|nr:hypothetical protein EST38_g4040 [Candolleomyces aberdarensis]